METKNKKLFDKLSSRAVSALFIALVIVVNVILYVLVNAFNLYLYSDEPLDLSVSGAADEIFKKASEEGKSVKISFLMTEEALSLDQTAMYVYSTAKSLEERYEGFISLEFINSVTRRRDSDGALVDLEKYKKDMHGNDTVLNKSTVIFECGDNYRVITDNATTAGFVDFFAIEQDGTVNAYNGEEIMTGLVCWVLADEHKTAYFTQSHGEIADVSLSNLLACAGYYVGTVDLRKESVPSDADILVISSPTSDFEQGAPGTDIETERERIEEYLQNGGRLFVALDPLVKKLPVLEGILQEYGISFSTTKTDTSSVRNIVKDPVNAITTDRFTLVADYASSDVANLISNRVKEFSNGGILMSTVSALEIEGDAVALLQSSSSAVIEADGKTVGSDGNYVLCAYSEKTGESGAKSSVLVVPSVYLAVSDTLVSREYANKEFLYSVFENLYGAKSMPYGCRAILLDTTTLENLRLGVANAYTAALLAIPVIIGIVGAAVIIRRKNR